MTPTADPYSLDRLQDIIAPAPTPWWPPAAGWYVIFCIAALWIGVTVFKSIATWQRNGYRRQALQELGQIEVGNFSGLSTLLKRVALVAYSRKRVASLIGSDWTTFLTTTCNGVDFESKPANSIGTASCETEPTLCDNHQWNRVKQHAATWISHHDQEPV